MLRHALRCLNYVMSCHYVMCHVRLCHVTVCHVCIALACAKLFCAVLCAAVPSEHPATITDVDLTWVSQAAFKAPSVSSLGTGSPKDPLSQSLDWDNVKAEDKTLVHQVRTHAHTHTRAGMNSYVAGSSAESVWQCITNDRHPSASVTTSKD